MGQWETERGRGSDEMADILGGALEKIGVVKLVADGEPPFSLPNLLDLADAIEFVTRGLLVVEVHPDAPPGFLGDPGRPLCFAGLLEDNPINKTIPNRGQIKGMKQ